MEFQIPSVDPKKHYAFYVKSKLHNKCATTDLWSEESNPTFWGKGERAGQDGFSVSQSQERGTGTMSSPWAPCLLLGTVLGSRPLL